MSENSLKKNKKDIVKIILVVGLTIGILLLVVGLLILYSDDFNNLLIKLISLLKQRSPYLLVDGNPVYTFWLKNLIPYGLLSIILSIIIFLFSLIIFIENKFYKILFNIFKNRNYIKVPPMISKRIPILVVSTVLILIGIFYTLTIRDGHNWGGDFSMYIHHAKNIVEGIDYQDTGFIYNPYFRNISPTAYPPVFPLLLSIVYNFFNLNFTAMKIEIIIIFILSLYIIYLTFKDELPFQYTFIILIIIGFNPYFWDFKDNILSDIPFLLFTYLSFFSIKKVYQKSKSLKKMIPYIILVSILIYLSYATKSVGLIIIPCLIIYELIKFKRLTAFTILVTIFFIVLMVIQNIFVQSSQAYLDQFVFNIKIIFSNIVSYSIAITELYDNGYILIISYVLSIIISGLALFGYIERVKKNITIYEIFFPLYLLVILIWPFYQGLRFLFPIIPLYFFYAFIGIRKTNIFKKVKIEKSIFIILIIIIIFSYIGKYTKLDYGPIDNGATKKEAVELFDYIKDKTGKEAIFIFRKPRVLALLYNFYS